MAKNRPEAKSKAGAPSGSAASQPLSEKQPPAQDKKLVLTAVAVIALALLLIVFLRPFNAPKTQSSPTPISFGATPSPTFIPTPEVILEQATPQPTPAPVVEHLVEIHDFYYRPDNVTVKTGEKVVWRNRGGVLHTVTSSDKTLNSPNLGPNMEYSHEFTSPGTYKYYDSLHAGAVGYVYVE